MMRTMILSGVLVGACLLALAGQAAASSVTFTAVPRDLWDLDHTKLYSWGIAWNLPQGEDVASAVLAIDHINNWTLEPNILYIHMLDNPQVGSRSWTDNERGGDNWRGRGPLVGTYVDHGIHAQDISFDLGALGLLDEFVAFAQNGVFGFGFDPDCHYYNDGITFTVVTQTVQHQFPEVPEPATIAGLVMAVGFVGGYARRRLAA